MIGRYIKTRCQSQSGKCPATPSSSERSQTHRGYVCHSNNMLIPIGGVCNEITLTIAVLNSYVYFSLPCITVLMQACKWYLRVNTSIWLLAYFVWITFLKCLIRSNLYCFCWKANQTFLYSTILLFWVLLQSSLCR